MKNLEKNKNIYVQHGRFYIDCQRDGVRIRRATGLKKSPLAFDFVRKNYDLFLGSKSDIAEAKRRYRELEDLQTDRLLRKGEKDAGATKNSSEFSFDSVIDRLLAEKSFLKDKTRRLYVIMSHTITEFLSRTNCGPSIWQRRQNPGIRTGGGPKFVVSGSCHEKSRSEENV